MNNAQLSIDKISIEYHGVTVKFYNQLALSLRDWFDIKPVIRHKRVCLSLEFGDG